MATTSSIGEYLATVAGFMASRGSDKRAGWKYTGLEDFVSKEGTRFTVPSANRLPTGVDRLLHAWLVTPDGEVVDPTWRELGNEYYGVPFKLDYVTGTVLANEYYGVLDSWQTGWPLLQGIDPVKWKAEVSYERK